MRHNDASSGYGDSRLQGTYATSGNTDITRKRIEREETLRTERLRNGRNLLIQGRESLKPEIAYLRQLDDSLNQQYNNIIRYPEYQKMILHKQEYYPPTRAILATYENDLSTLHYTQYTLNERYKLVNQNTTNCQRYNNEAMNHNITAREGNKVQIIDLQSSFTPSNLDLSDTGLKQAIRNLIWEQQAEMDPR